MTGPDQSATATLKNRDSGIMPWQIAAAGLTGLLALTLTTGFLPLTPVFALAILASYFIPARLEGQTFSRWGVRLALIILVIVLTQVEPSNNDYAIGQPRVRNIMALVYAAEFVVQCWRRSGEPVRSRLIAIMASGLLMLSAANTFNNSYIKFVAPVYVLFVGLALYTGRTRRLSLLSTTLRLIFLVFALGLGGTAYLTINFNRSQIMELGNRLVGEHFNLEATGMASSPQLGEMFGLRGSTARVLRIHHLGGDGHLRGMAFDAYTFGRWSPGFMERRYRVPSNKDLNPNEALHSNAMEMQVERLATDNPLIYAPLAMAYLSPGDATDVDWSQETGGPIRSRARPPYEYRVGVAPSETYQGLLANRVDTQSRGRYLEIPPRFDRRVPILAKRITEGAKTDSEKVKAVADYLLSNYSYSLRFKPGVGDPLVNFLTAEPKRPAHCEYFAAASAILLRCVGVPTRYVTGYLAHESEEDGSIIVRQRDAHAWSEAWVEGTGWVTVDATPGDGRPDEDNSPVEWWRTAWEKIQDGSQLFAEFLAGLTTEQVIAIIVTIVVGGVIYATRLYRKRRLAQALRAFAYTPPEIRLAEIIIRFEALFAKRGMAFPAEKPYREHLDLLAAGTVTKGVSPQTLSPLLDKARQFVTVYDRTRFGNRRDTEALDTLSHLIDEMERTK